MDNGHTFERATAMGHRRPTAVRYQAETESMVREMDGNRNSQVVSAVKFMIGKISGNDQTRAGNPDL